MASIALMIGGAFLNATTFVGGSYLARILSGKDADAERVRHDKALEKYQRDYEAYQENWERIADWIQEQDKAEYQAFQNLSNKDKALKLYNQVPPNEEILGAQGGFSNYYRPNQSQKMGEMAYLGGGMLALTFLASRWF